MAQKYFCRTTPFSFKYQNYLKRRQKLVVKELDFSDDRLKKSEKSPALQKYIQTKKVQK